ncbi:hypothetical protein SAMN05660463_01114 [Pseudomonas sp. URIL14HWK12:I9]|nr:hypothetical protein F474_02126 [Pseudomonas sp. URIL14HWK12:I12]PVZ24725.1 hypothetical protein F470_01781 [Pseudomonas sp. URIL14HWK12:I10]PVZ34570.1 hypothetical protein F472_02126 [Pseudomonas sp. URIL14HWK12:I11]SNZ08685.1 hypothetical protein SAMN05660463_01114 [Pseudomonas sp. URIL14HWK12:I9]
MPPALPDSLSPLNGMARARAEARFNLPKLFAAIDADPGIVGAGVVFIDEEFNVITLREFRPICSILPKRIILRATPRYTSPQQFVQKVENNPRESRLVVEAANMALSCTGAVLSWLVVFSGTVAVPFTGGASLALTYLGGAAATAATLQCVAGGVRTAAEVADPSFNDALDDSEWYTTTMSILDVVSLAGAGGSALTTVKYVRTLKASTGRPWRAILGTLNRAERKRLTQELLKIKDPTLTGKLLKLEQRAGRLPVRHSPTELRHATKTMIKDSLGGALSLVGSGASGNLNSIALALYEEVQ